MVWEASQSYPLSLSLLRGALGVETVSRVRAASCKDLSVQGRQQRKNESPGGGTRKDMAQLRQRSKLRDGLEGALGTRRTLILTSFSSFFSLFSPPSRKPSFPFQWAWESFIIDGQALLQSSSSMALGHRPLLFPPAAPQCKPRHKSVANISEDLRACHKMEVQNLGRRYRPGAWANLSLPPGKAESQGIERSSFWSSGKGSGSESEDISEVEGQNSEEAEKSLSPAELPQLPGQGLILEEELISEAMEEEEHSDPSRRKGSFVNKGRNSGEKGSEDGDSQSRNQGSSSNSLRKLQKVTSRAKDLKGPWDLERLHRQLQEELECG